MAHHEFTDPDTVQDIFETASEGDTVSTPGTKVFRVDTFRTFRIPEGLERDLTAARRWVEWR